MASRASSARPARARSAGDASSLEPVAVCVCLLSIIEGELNVLVIRRREPPSEGLLALPEGSVRSSEPLEAAAERALRESTGISGIYLEQLYTFGEPERDPRARRVMVAYVALIPSERLRLRPGVDPLGYGWARIVPGRTANAWKDGIVDVDGAPVAFAFDHERIIRTAIHRVRGKLTYTTIGFQLVPEAFTLSELQNGFEVVLCKRLSKPAFRRKILDAGVVEPTGKKRRGGHRPAKLYRFIREPGGEL